MRFRYRCIKSNLLLSALFDLHLELTDADCIQVFSLKDGLGGSVKGSMVGSIVVVVIGGEIGAVVLVLEEVLMMAVLDDVLGMVTVVLDVLWFL